MPAETTTSPSRSRSPRSSPACRQCSAGRTATSRTTSCASPIVTLDESRHEVFRGDTPIELTATEFNLLRFFMLNPRRVLSKSQILQNVWHYDFGGSRNVVETYVSYLRRKLDAAGPPLIRTVRQVGYMLEAERSRWPSRLSLRARLILGVVALAGVGLVTADVVTYTSLHSFLISRTDDFLDTAHSSAESALQGPSRGPARRRAAVVDRPKARTSDGSRRECPGCSSRFGARTGRSWRPGPRRSSPARRRRRLRACRRRSCRRRIAAPTGSATSRSKPPTVASRYRVRASIDPSSNGYTLIVATSLSSVDSTLHRLVLVELLVTLAVLAGVAMLGLWVIRIGLRPLTEIGATAATIAAGDLSQRVARDDDRTEVGTARAGAERDARPDRVGLQRSRSVRTKATALRRRRFARAAHAARSGAGLCRAVLARSRAAAGRPRALDGGDHPRVRAHEPARRGSAPARAPRRGPAARARAGRACTTSWPSRSRPPGCSSRSV